jgi:hypothetical protein
VLCIDLEVTRVTAMRVSYHGQFIYLAHVMQHGHVISKVASDISSTEFGKTLADVEAQARAGKPVVLGHFGPAAVPTQVVYRMSKTKGWVFKPVTFPAAGWAQLAAGDADMVTAPNNTVAGQLKSGHKRARSWSLARSVSTHCRMYQRCAKRDMVLMRWCGPECSRPEERRL